MTRAAVIHLLTEFAPVLVFFVAGQITSFFTATALLVISTFIALVIGWLYERRIPFLPIVSGIFVIVSGLITLLYSEPDALILADTLYYLLLALVVGAGLPYHRYFLKWLFESTFAMHDTGWRILSLRWFAVFMVAGVVNEAVRLLASPEFWIDYRFVKVILIAVFGFWQFRLSRRYRIPEISNEWGLRLERFSPGEKSSSLESPER